MISFWYIELAESFDFELPQFRFISINIIGRSPNLLWSSEISFFSLYLFLFTIFHWLNKLSEKGSEQKASYLSGDVSGSRITFSLRFIYLAGILKFIEKIV